MHRIWNIALHIVSWHNCNSIIIKFISPLFKALWWCQKLTMRNWIINKNVVKTLHERKNKWGFKLKMTGLRMSGWQWLENLYNRWEFPGQTSIDQSETSILVMWSVWTNQRTASLWMRKFQSSVESRWNRLWRSSNKSKYHPEQVPATTGKKGWHYGTCQTGV